MLKQKTVLCLHLFCLLQINSSFTKHIRQNFSDLLYILTYLMILNDVTARRFIVLYGLIINCSTCVPVAKSNT